MSGVPVNIQRRQVSADSNTRTSGYFILINSNKQRNTLTQAAADSYRAAVEQFVQGHFRTCIRFVGDDGASWSKKWIDKVDISRPRSSMIGTAIAVIPNMNSSLSVA